ncbi:hypothetical protein TEA_010400 [Camellia sinensis var. sinensis]|uniref:Uncharacterized protein n=1 Tax=Camellia sinensis var. sinensis TaxID=542762 RepID=A0A4S4DVX2_CAMSN|nr:hypothetical protein TEA_010400 [Camellia sinensis var. sinensis]
MNKGAASGEMASFSQRWKWSRPDIHTYTLLVRGLAASLRVSDALKIIGAVSRVGVSPGEEVPFGKIVRCPTCMIAVTVAQPQHGIDGLRDISHIPRMSTSESVKLNYQLFGALRRFSI